MKVQWAKFIVVLVLYLLFLYWVKSWWGLLVVPFIYDVYISKKIKWQWWKDSEGPIKFVMCRGSMPSSSLWWLCTSSTCSSSRIT